MALLTVLAVGLRGELTDELAELLARFVGVRLARLVRPGMGLPTELADLASERYWTSSSRSCRPRSLRRQCSCWPSCWPNSMQC